MTEDLYKEQYDILQVIPSPVEAYIKHMGEEGEECVYEKVLFFGLVKYHIRNLDNEVHECTLVVPLTLDLCALYPIEGNAELIYVNMNDQRTPRSIEEQNKKYNQNH